MHAIIVKPPRLIEPVSSAPRWRWRGQRTRSRLHRFGRRFVARVTGGWTGLIKALHESRRRSAARLIDQHRHLIGDEYRACHASLETRSSGPVQP